MQSKANQSERNKRQSTTFVCVCCEGARFVSITLNIFIYLIHKHTHTHIYIHMHMLATYSNWVVRHVKVKLWRMREGRRSCMRMGMRMEIAINCALSQIIDSLLASLPTQTHFPACLSFLAAFSFSPITSHSDAAIKHRHLLVRISMDACALCEMFHCPLSEDSNHAQGRIQLDSKWVHICSCCCWRCGCSFCFVAIDEFLLLLPFAIAPIILISTASSNVVVGFHNSSSSSSAKIALASNFVAKWRRKAAHYISIFRRGNKRPSRGFARRRRMDGERT